MLVVSSFLLVGVHSSSLTNHTHIKLGVVLDKFWISKYGANADQIEEIIADAVELANAEFLKHTKITVVWLGLDVDTQEGMSK